MGIWVPWLFFWKPDYIYRSFLIVTVILYGVVMLTIFALSLLSAAGINLPVEVGALLVGLWISVPTVIINGLLGHFSAKYATYYADLRRKNNN